MTRSLAPENDRNPLTPETPTAKLDRVLHAAGAPLTGGVAPIALALMAGYLPDTPKPIACQAAEVTSRLEAA